jgi:hypothetical protein
MTLVAFWIDVRARKDSKDYAFWLYLFGVLTFWGGLSLLNSGSTLGKFLYLCINIAMIFIGAVLGRRVFAVFGGIGVAMYMSLSAAADAIAKGELKARALAEGELARIAATDAGIEAWAYLDPARVRAEADRCDAGMERVDRCTASASASRTSSRRPTSRRRWARRSTPDIALGRTPSVCED